MTHPTHFSAEMFNRMAGVTIVHVPYKGIPEALGEVMSGRVQYVMSSITNVLPLINDGKVLALGVALLKRATLLPEVATIKVSGLPDYSQVTWFGLLAPANTPRARINRLNRDIARVLDLPEMRQRWSAIGAEAAPISSEQFDRLVAGDIETFTRLARADNIKAD